ncbi:lipopolysaccharide kinase InaA family protein [Candidatus Uhrbacteria bacterium]|nr:lipopolysaccharide kinase InaA family protein [Candidatus Uhrbacteria bacterium]
MSNPFEGLQGAESVTQEAREQRLEHDLRKEIGEVFNHLVASSIGEGEQGIVVSFNSPAFAGICAKYQKLGYDGTEFRRLQEIYAAGKQVPRPYFEMSEKNMFVMERVPEAQNLEELMKKGYKFTREIAEDVEEIAKDFCEDFNHNDFFPRNILLESPVIENGIVISGTPIIIDFNKSAQGKSDEYQRVKGWFRNRMATS